MIIFAGTYLFILIMILQSRKFLILYIFLQLSGSFLFAQEIIFSTAVNHFCKITFQPPKNTVFAYDNEILREIAKDILKEPGRVKIQANFTINLKITQRQGKNQLYISYSNPFITGDTRYRKFLLSDVLLPSLIHLKVFWVKKNNPSNVSITTFHEKIGNQDENLILSGCIPDFDPASDTIYAGEIALHYDSLDLLRFNTRIGLINDYYASRALLDSLDSFQYVINVEDADKIPLSFIQVLESDKILYLIMERNFPDQLLSQNEDHLNLMEKFSSRYRAGRSIHFTFFDLLLASGAIFWKGNISEYADYFTQRILSYIRRAQLLGEFQGNIYQDYLDHWFLSNAFQDDKQTTETILAKMYPDAGRDTLVAFAAKQVYQSYLRLSSQLMDHGQYAEARALLEHAGKFRMRIPFSIHTSEAERIQQEAARGVYHSFLGIVSGCIELKKPEMASKYLEKAYEYRKMYADLLPDDSLYLKVSMDLLLFRLNSPDRLMQDMRIRELFYCPE